MVTKAKELGSRLALRARKADRHTSEQAYDAPSPNSEMVIDSEYVENDPEKDPVAIINPDNLESEADQLHDLPLATDRTS